jgi:hypothetical protein
LLDHNEDAWAKVLEDGFSGLTGRPGHDDWYTPGGEEIHKIVKSLWNPEEFECAWVSLVQVCYCGKIWGANDTAAQFVNP